MMEIHHRYSTASAKGKAAGPVGFHLGSSTSWLSFATTRQSRYEGWFIEDTRTVPSSYVKIIERVAIEGNPVPTGLLLTEATAQWGFPGNTSVGFAALSGKPGLCLQTTTPTTWTITLDMRGIYQAPEFGRQYSVKTTAKGALITYTDSLLYTPVYLDIITDGMVHANLTWEEVEYPWDEGRHSSPTKLHVCTIQVSQASWICAGAGFTDTEAVAASSATADCTDFSVPDAAVPDNALIAAVRGAETTLTSLTTPNGLYAGLPWFHQIWSRDELIAALGLKPAGQLSTIKRYAASVLDQGQLPTYIGSGTSCADGLGWLALLIREYGITKLKAPVKQKLGTLFREAVLQLQGHQLSNDGLIESGHNATWMDTIGRTGVRVEIQAMYALILETADTLNGTTQFTQTRLDHLSKAKRALYHGGRLWDGESDPALRPNVFLAYLLCPELLTQEEWEGVCTQTLTTLQLPWGGLASLDSSDAAFQPESTGQDNRSYHQGDSWFFVNGLAGVALHRLNAKLFAPAISQLLEGSTNEILWKHVAGQAGEIASAHSGESWGCGVQGFSAGAFLFLTNTLKKA